MMKNKLAKLIDVKTIVTFTLTADFTYLVIKHQIEPQIFMTIYTTIIGFYFGTQYQKHIKGGSEND